MMKQSILFTACVAGCLILLGCHNDGQICDELPTPLAQQCTESSECPQDCTQTCSNAELNSLGAATCETFGAVMRCVCPCEICYFGTEY